MVEERQIPVDGNNIYCRIYNSGNENIPLIAVHGGPGSNLIYLESIAELSDEMPVVFYDQLGCGLSDKPENNSKYNLGYFTGELRNVIRSLGYKRVNLLGNSWGTMIAVNYCLKYSAANVNSLVLSGACLDVYMWVKDQRKNMKKLSQEYFEIMCRCEEASDYRNEDYLKIIKEYYNNYLCRKEPMPALLKKSFSNLNNDLYFYMWGPSEFTCTGTLKGQSFLNDLRKLRMPVLYTCGEFDECSPEAAKIYQHHTPGSVLVIFKNASHTHHLEKEKEYNKVLREFLNQNKS